MTRASVRKGLFVFPKLTGLLHGVHQLFFIIEASNDAGFNINFVLEHQSCVVLSTDIVPIDLMSANGEDIGRQVAFVAAKKKTIRNFENAGLLLLGNQFLR